jgi:hypothetical protein
MLWMIMIVGTAAGCDAIDATTSIEAKNAAIEDGTRVPDDNTWLLGSTVVVSTGRHRCTGFIIGPRHVITAAHCIPRPHADVRFYLSGASFPSSTPAYTEAVEVYEMRGVDDLNDSFFDARDLVKSLFLCECLTREHRAPVVHAAAA